MRRPQLLLLAAATAVLLGGAVWRAISTRDAQYARVTRRLDGNVSGTVAAVERWIEERRYDAATAAEEVDSLAPYLASPDAARRAAAGASLRHVLHRLRAGHGYMNAWAIDSAGRALAAAVPGAPAEAELAAARRALAHRSAQLCDPFPLSDGKAALCYAVAARDAGGLHDPAAAPAQSGDPGFVIVLRSNPLGSLMPLVTASDVAGSERTYLVGRADGGDSLALISSDGAGRDPRANLAKLPLSRVPALIRAALDGVPTRGRLHSIDGGEALGAARPVRGTPWAVVRRVGSAEVKVTLRRQLWTELLLAAAALAAGRWRW